MMCGYFPIPVAYNQVLSDSPAMKEDVQKKEISPGVFLLKSQLPGLTSKYEEYVFKVEVKILKIVEFECDFTGSQNVTIREPSTSTLRCT